MLSLPPLIEEDIQCMESALDELLQKSEAMCALLIDKGGPLICQRGVLEGFDTTTMAALAAGSFAANEAIAGLVGESNFASIYQQGEHHSLLVGNVGGNLLLIVIFKAAMSVGAVKYFAAATVQKVACQLERARDRTPDASLDLVSLNLANTEEIFRKKAQ
jgi:predicted regulator of Ras-like GTPase activity (Roadblock/LC7/MglB family)